MAKHKEIRLRMHDLVFIVVAIFMLGAILGMSFLPKPQEKFTNMDIPESSVDVGIPAVDAEGRGVVGRLYTTVKPGTGKILFNVDNILSQLDTQFSSRTAVKAAADYMNIDPSSIDVIFNLKVNATIVEGPSAGSAMASSVVLALKGISPDNVMMTGTIEEDGKIGDVGAIEEKARAAKENGATLFIVPAGQASDTTSRSERKCDSFDSIRVCTIKYVRESRNISLSLNITVVEAGTLEDIVKIFEEKEE